MPAHALSGDAASAHNGAASARDMEGKEVMPQRNIERVIGGKVLQVCGDIIPNNAQVALQVSGNLAEQVCVSSGGGDG